MKHILTTILLTLSVSAFAQNNFHEQQLETRNFQHDLNVEFSTKEESPLTQTDLDEFKYLPFFDFDTTFCVTAVFKKAKKMKSVELKTSTERKPLYDIYGTVSFTIDDKKFTLNVYQSHSLREKEEYADYLFLPFMDLSNGKTTYAGGRYLDLRIPESNQISINFNLAYNPYCAYNSKYSCPIVPEKNFLDLEVNAGVKAPKAH